MEHSREQLVSDLGKVPIMSTLSRDELGLFVDRAEVASFPAGTLLIEQGEKTSELYVVLSGRVRVFLVGTDHKTGHVREITLAVEGQGSFIGEISLLDLEPRTASVVTLEYSTFMMISRESLTRTIEQNSQVALSLMQGITRRFRSNIENIKDLAFNSSYRRLVSVLMSLSEPLGDDDIRIIEGRYTHQNLADLIGSSRVMVSRILKDLALGGCISTGQCRIVINRKLPDQY